MQKLLCNMDLSSFFFSFMIADLEKMYVKVVIAQNDTDLSCINLILMFENAVLL